MANEGSTDGTIAMLENGIEEAEANIRALRTAINTICVAQGHPPRYAEEQLAASGGGRLTQIKDDTFYGKKQTPAMRDYLEMRKAQNLGPATPREIYDALQIGGFQFEAKEEHTRLVSMRALLRTQPLVFHRLPQGAYGLTSWYPDAKRSKGDGPETKAKKSAAKKRPAKTAAKAARKDQPALKVVEPAKGGGEEAA